MLTEKQDEVYKTFEEIINNRKVELLSSHQRQWGKTHILNELGFNLQVMGCKVYLLTQFPNSNEHFATNYISNDLHLEEFRGVQRDKIVVIIDEYKYNKIHPLLDFCKKHRIPVVGFVDYDTMYYHLLDHLKERGWTIE
jgi:hypothetical protein